jgi:hypothetical protein
MQFLGYLCNFTDFNSNFTWDIIYTAESCILEPGSVEDEIAVEKLKGYNSPDMYQIPAEFIQPGNKTLHSYICKLNHSVLIKEELPQQWKELLYLRIKRAVKLTVVIIDEYLIKSYRILSTIILLRLTSFIPKIIEDC